MKWPGLTSRKYAVDIEGQDYCLDLTHGEPPKVVGFHTCRGVSARDLDAAVERAVDRVRKSERLNAMLRPHPAAIPTLYARAVYELPDDAVLSDWDRGFVFYADDDEAPQPSESFPHPPSS